MALFWENSVNQKSETEENLILAMSYTLLGSMVGAGILLSLGVTAPYGRYYAEKSLGINWGSMVPGKAAWIIQEAPSLLIPLYCLWIGQIKSTPNLILTGYFVFHYFNRTIVFPLQI